MYPNKEYNRAKLLIGGNAAFLQRISRRQALSCVRAVPILLGGHPAAIGQVRLLPPYAARAENPAMVIK